MEETKPLLIMENIDKTFPGVRALQKASLKVNRGEIHTIIGQNGAGKSTLIKILTGAYRRDSGTIIFDGQPVDFHTPQQSQANGISTIYQEVNLIPYRSVSENIFVGRKKGPFGLVNWGMMNREAKALLARFNINIDVTRPLLSYTIAVQQMVAIARAVSFKSKLVIMDEPTSSLDDSEVALLFEVIEQLKSDGVSVIFISHRLDELYKVCDVVTIMRDGQTVHSRPLKELSRLDLVALMLGKEIGEVERSGATGFNRKDRQIKELVLEASALKRAPRLQEANVNVREGEIVALAGLLGSGRTEVARAIFGADALQSGEVRLNGAKIRFNSPGQAIRAGVGFCSEDRKSEGIVPSMSVRDNLTLALLPFLAKKGIVSRSAQQNITDKFIKRLGIKASSAEQPIRELSGGNQQKVLLARWLCLNPRLLILDEPTRGIDVGAKAEIQALIEELASKGLGVLMISSELEELVEGSDRVVVLRDGRTIKELQGEEITSEAIMGVMAHGEELASVEKVGVNVHV